MARGEKESGKVWANTNVTAFHGKLQTRGNGSRIDGRCHRWCFLVSVRTLADQLYLFIAKRSIRSHLGYKFTLQIICIVYERILIIIR